MYPWQKWLMMKVWDLVMKLLENGVKGSCPHQQSLPKDLCGYKSHGEKVGGVWDLIMRLLGGEGKGSSPYQKNLLKTFADIKVMGSKDCKVQIHYIEGKVHKL